MNSWNKLVIGKMKFMFLHNNLCQWINMLSELLSVVIKWLWFRYHPKDSRYHMLLRLPEICKIFGNRSKEYRKYSSGIEINHVTQTPKSALFFFIITYIPQCQTPWTNKLWQERCHFIGTTNAQTTKSYCWKIYK